MRIIAVFYVVLLLAGFSFSVNVSSCTIIQSSGTYNLTNDISGAPYSYYYGSYTTCIQINASSVTLDCGGHSINTTGTSNIEIEAPGTNVIIQNCVLNNGTGVEILGLQGGRIVYNRINPTYAGIDATLAGTATGNDYLYNNITGGSYGFFVPGDNNLIGNNLLVNQGQEGIYDYGDGNWISNNQVSGSSGDGMVLAGQNMRVESNTISNCGQVGIFLGADSSTISNNYVSGSGSHGIQLGDGYYETYLTNVSSNHVWSNAGDGIHVEGGYSNRINSNEVYQNSRGIVILNGYYSEYGWEYTINDVVSNNHVYSNTGDGIYTINTSLNNFISNNASLNGGSGLVADNSSKFLIDPSYLCNNSGDGLTLSNSVNVNVTDSVFCNNSGDGINVANVNSSLFQRNSASDNGGDGFEMSQGTGNSVINNSAYSNDQTGFSVGSMTYSRFMNNTATYNSNEGYEMGYVDYVNMTNNTANYNTVRGFYLVASTHMVLNNNTAWYNGNSGYQLFNEANWNNLTDNSAFDNDMHGIEVYSSSNNRLVRNTANQNTRSGIIVYEYKSTVPTDNNTLTNNLAFINDYGIYLDTGSYNTTLADNGAYNNRIAQLEIRDTSAATITGDEYSGSAYGAVIEGISGGSYRMNGVTFTEPGGSFVNLTNISIIDTFGSADNYTINWTSRSDLPTPHHLSFRYKFVNISDRETSTIDYISFNWITSDLSGYNESRLQLWKYNSSGWVLQNSSPSLSGHNLSLTNMDPSSDYAIYQWLDNCVVISSPTLYTQTRNFVGAPNSASEVWGPATACVKIAASNVIYDCSGFSILNNDTPGNRYGVVLNDSAHNVTFRNCPNIGNYDWGLVIGPGADNNLIQNVTIRNNSIGIRTYNGNYSGNVIRNCTVYNNSDSAIDLWGNASNTVIANCVIYDSNEGIEVHPDFTSINRNTTIANNTIHSNSARGIMMLNNVYNSTIRNNTIYNNSYGGVYLWVLNYPVTGNIIVNNSVFNNSQFGVMLSGSQNNSLINNTAYNNTNVGFYLYSSSNNTLTRNSAYNNSQYGFYIYLSSNNNTLTNNTAYSNTQYGFYLRSDSNYNTLTNNTAYNNLQHGFLIGPNSHNNSITNNTAYNMQYGFYFGSATNNTLTRNSAYNNSQCGFYLDTSSNNLLTANNATNNSYGFNSKSSSNTFVNNIANNNSNGFFLNQSSDNNLTSNTAYNNSQNGLYLYSGQGNRFLNNTAYRNQLGLSLVSASSNRLENNTAYNNTADGIILTSSSSCNLTGNVLYLNTNDGMTLATSSSNNRIINNSAYNNGQMGFYAYSSSNNNLFANNSATANNQAGFYMNVVDSNNLTGNNIRGWGNYGMLLSGTNNILITNNFVSSVSNGIRVSVSSLNTVLQNNTINGSTQYGLSIREADNTAITNDHYYNNAADFQVNGTGITVNLSGVVFDNPAGDYTNYTNISLNDTVASSYSIDWTNNATSLPLPANSISFAQKFVNITPLSGAVSIDSIVWHWLQSEIVDPYDESTFQLWKNNGTWAYVLANLDGTANTLSLNGLSTFSNFAILQVTPPEGGEEPQLPGEDYDVNIIPACGGFIVSVTDGGSPVNDSFVEGMDNTNDRELTPRYTNSSGQAYFSGCDVDVSVKASKAGRSGTDSGTADCGICPECATDDDCADSEQCTNLQCVPIDCPNGRVIDHTCERYECVKDSDCKAGQVCKDHHCIVPYECRSDSDCAATKYCDIKVGDAGGNCKNVTIQPCGEVKDHKFVAYGYECGTEPGCPSCGQGFYCQNHTCIQNDVSCPSTGIVGDRKTCEAKENNLPCVNCDYVVTDPTGKNFTGKSDENGNFILPLNIKGTYKVTLLKNGQPVRIVEVKALPVSQPGGENPPTTAGGLDTGTMALFLVILLVFGIAAILYWRRRSGEKKGK